MTALEGVRCNGCGLDHYRRTFSQPSAGAVRKLLKPEGWHTTRGTIETASGYKFGYTRDICPDCWKDGIR